MGDRENTGQQQQQGPANTQPQLPPAVAALAPNPEEPHSPEIQHQPNEKPHDSAPWRNPDWYMVGLTALLFLVGAVTLIVFYDQFGEMQKQTGILNAQAQQASLDSAESARKVERQLAIAQKQATAAQNSANAIQRQTRTVERAWITISNPAAAITTVENQPITSKVTFSNSGNTATKNILVEVVVELVKNGDDPKFDYTWDHTSATTGLLLKGEAIEILGSTYKRQRSLNGRDTIVVPFPHEEYQRFIAWDSYIAIYARAKYTDIFGVHHWVQRCGWAAAPLPSGITKYFSAHKCTAYSDIDRH